MSSPSKSEYFKTQKKGIYTQSQHDIKKIKKITVCTVHVPKILKAYSAFTETGASSLNTDIISKKSSNVMFPSFELLNTLQIRSANGFTFNSGYCIIVFIGRRMSRFFETASVFKALNLLKHLSLNNIFMHKLSSFFKPAYFPKKLKVVPIFYTLDLHYYFPLCKKRQIQIVIHFLVGKNALLSTHLALKPFHSTYFITFSLKIHTKKLYERNKMLSSKNGKSAFFKCGFIQA